MMFAAATCRLLFFLQSRSAPTFLEPIVDSRTYHDLAMMLASGESPGDRLLWQGVWYPLYLSGVYAVFGASIVAAKAIQILLGLGTVYLTYLSGLRFGGVRLGLLSGWIVALYGPLVFFEQQLLPTGTAAFVSAALTYAAIRLWDCRGRTQWFLFGVIGALSVYVRPTMIPVAIGLLAQLFRAVWRDRQRLATVGAYLAGALVVVSIISGLVWQECGRLGIVPESGPINVFIGNNPNSDETILIRPGEEWAKLLRRPENNGYPPGVKGGNEYFRREVIRFVYGSPLRFQGGLVNKSLALVTSRELPRTVDIYFHRQWSECLAVSVFRIGEWGFPFRVLFPFAVLGLITDWRRYRSGPILLVVAFQALSIVLVFSAARYRIAIIPGLAIMAGSGALALIRSIRSGAWKSGALSGLIVAAVLVLQTLPGPFPQETESIADDLYFEVGKGLYEKGLWESSKHFLVESIALDPGRHASRQVLGIVLAELGDCDGAVDQLLMVDSGCDSPMRQQVKLAREQFILGKSFDRIPE